MSTYNILTFYLHAKWSCELKLSTQQLAEACDAQHCARGSAILCMAMTDESLPIAYCTHAGADTRRIRRSVR
jgi:hypothetical protein